ncbi:hypothetical protein [Clostridium sp. C2-6-12]|uniref:hypothetical protein n=1 Tax=Clostridium sp. C2-6-12 TaxID=2698832 RepID=UPI00136BC8B4|nr:hypothetical protein [Clostridium sp. C2-6-12]
MLCSYLLNASVPAVIDDFYTYSNFIELSKMFHIQLVPILGDENGMIADELEKKLADVIKKYTQPNILRM